MGLPGNFLLSRCAFNSGELHVGQHAVSGRQVAKLATVPVYKRLHNSKSHLGYQVCAESPAFGILVPSLLQGRWQSTSTTPWRTAARMERASGSRTPAESPWDTAGSQSWTSATKANSRCRMATIDIGLPTMEKFTIL